MSDKNEQDLRARLSPLQYEVTQNACTEPPFRNEYWNEKRPGIYVDVVTGVPLFSSLDKFDSGTGWPSFTRPLSQEVVSTKIDRSHGMTRIEVRSAQGDNHLGHVFDDGPAPTHIRFCMNSAALRFVPVEKLEEEGYGEYRKLFEAPRALEVATLAGGCFWGMEEIIRAIPGVVDTEVGYTGGELENATYEQVKRGHTGHAESVKVTFDPAKLSYEALLGWFFRMHDPTTENRQGNDVGTQYRSTIFVHSPEQRETALKVKAQVDASGKWPRPVVTSIEEASEFWTAERYHQDYLQKNPGGYSCHWLRD